MIEHQEHYGRKFYKDLEKGYWISTDYPRIRAHRWVWLNIHKMIPKGYHIHHINENKSDNRIENLELIEKSRHMSHHMQEPERKNKAREMADKYRPLTKEWHKSEEGRAWHKLHALKCNFGNNKPVSKVCDVCSKEYKTKVIADGRSKFCSNKCKSQWRRNSGLDNIERNCITCQKTFMINKYSKVKNCSKSCAKKKK